MTRFAKKRVPTEHSEQLWLLGDCRRRWPQLLIIAIPNAGRRTLYERTQLKAEGMTAGVPDLFIPALNLWIELKRTKASTTSRAQKEMLAKLQSAGHTAVIAKGHEEALAHIEKAMAEKMALSAVSGPLAQAAKTPSHLDLPLIINALLTEPKSSLHSPVIFSGWDKDFTLEFILKPLAVALGPEHVQAKTPDGAQGTICGRPYTCLSNGGSERMARKQGRSLTAGLVFYHVHPSETKAHALESLRMALSHEQEGKMIQLHF